MIGIHSTAIPPNLMHTSNLRQHLEALRNGTQSVDEVPDITEVVDALLCELHLAGQSRQPTEQCHRGIAGFRSEAFVRGAALQ